MTSTNVLQTILQAEQKIRPYIRKTPLEYSPHMSKTTRSQVFWKLENLQFTGSFKVRGAMNALLSLPKEQCASGVVAASSGNHGIAVAFGLNTLNINGTIFVPEDTSSAKVAAISNYEVDTRSWSTVFPHAEVIGCSPMHSPVMAKSVQAGQILEMESLPTLSDGTAGGIEKDAITFPLCQRLVDDYILVSEDEIRYAMRLFIETHHMLIEGAAGVPLAALLKMPERFEGKTVIIVLCGANISLETLKTVIERH